MAKILEKIDDDAHDAMKWLAAEYKYLNELKEDLDNIKKDISNIKQEKKDVKIAEKLLTQIGRCERRATRYEKRLDEDLQQLLKGLPSDLAEKCANVERNLRIAMDNILKNTSRYVGDLKDSINKLKLQVSLLEQYKSKPDKQQEINSTINELIEKLEEQVDYITRWVSSLSVDLKQVEEFERKLVGYQ